MFVHPNVYHALIKPPIKMLVSDITKYGFVMKLSSHHQTETLSWDIPKSLVSATFLPKTDFCTSNDFCVTSMGRYLVEAEAYKNKCVMKNDADMVGKYSYCDGKFHDFLAKFNFWTTYL